MTGAPHNSYRLITSVEQGHRSLWCAVIADAAPNYDKAFFNSKHFSYVAGLLGLPTDEIIAEINRRRDAKNARVANSLRKRSRRRKKAA